MLGYLPSDTKLGGVETHAEARKCAELFRRERDRIDGVLVAGKNDGRYLKDGKEVYVPGPDLFTDVHTLHVDGLGDREAYPNRNSYYCGTW